MRKIYSQILIVAVSVLFLGCLAPALVSADCASPASTKEAIQCGSSNSAGVPVSSDASGSLNGTITSALNLLSVFIGVVAVVMIMLAGFRYITSGGKQESVASAKNSLTYAIIGLIIVALAQVIARFVLSKTT